MLEHIGSLKQNPTQKFTKYSSILKNTKKFSKTQNLGLNVWNAWKIENEIIPVKRRTF